MISELSAEKKERSEVFSYNTIYFLGVIINTDYKETIIPG
jgi:hypothetical protein